MYAVTNGALQVLMRNAASKLTRKSRIKSENPVMSAIGLVNGGDKSEENRKKDMETNPMK